MKLKRYFLFTVAISTILMQACDNSKLEVTPPGYIKIDEFQISDACYPNEPDRLPLVTNRVTDAWIFIDGILQGAYELPAEFPVIEEGVKTVEVRPGVLQNGVSGTRVIYPYYEFYSEEVDFQSNESVVIEPCLAYRKEGAVAGEIKVVWAEDFEGVIDLSYEGKSDTVVTLVSSEGDVVEGNFSGGIFLESTDDFFELISPTLTNLPVTGTPIYLELDYRSNHDFFVGLYTRDLTQQLNLVGVRARDSWNKLYIDFSDLIRFNGDSPNFNIFIGFVKDPDTENVQMYLDNIKLMHF